MPNIPCLRCLTTDHHTPVALTGGVYRCPACGFTAQVRRVKVADIFWGVVDVQPGPVWWAAGQAHCVEQADFRRNKEFVK